MKNLVVARSDRVIDVVMVVSIPKINTPVKTGKFG